MIYRTKKANKMKSQNETNYALVINKSVCPEVSSDKLKFKTYLLNDGAPIGAWRDAVRTAIIKGANAILMIGRGRQTHLSEKWDAVVVTDQINVSGQNPLVGQNDDKFGTRFPDMSGLYSVEMVNKLLKAGKKTGLVFQSGVLLVPVNIEGATTLERKILSQNKIAALSRDVFSGAITAKHAGCRCAGLILFKNLNFDQLKNLITNIER